MVLSKGADHVLAPLVVNDNEKCEGCTNEPEREVKVERPEARLESRYVDEHGDEDNLLQNGVVLHHVLHAL